MVTLEQGGARITPPPLSHIFTALYHDGELVVQTPEDVPRSGGDGSAFSDVDVKKVRVFFLEQQGDNGSLFSVHLDDGHFEVNGAVLALGDSGDIPPEAQRELVYFRRVMHVKTSSADTGEVTSRSMTRFYCIGWVARWTDHLGPHEVKRTIEVGHEVF